MKKKIEREKTTSVGFFIWLSVIYERNNPIATSKAYWRLLRSIFAHIHFKYSILFFTLLNYFYLFFPPSLSLFCSALCSIYSCFMHRNREEKKFSFLPLPLSLLLTFYSINTIKQSIETEPVMRVDAQELWFSFLFQIFHFYYRSLFLCETWVINKQKLIQLN